MNNDLEQFSEERLKELASTPEKYDHRYTCNMLNGDESRALARIALSAKQAKPEYHIVRLELNDAWGNEAELNAYESQLDASKCKDDHGGVIIPCYTTPQPAHTEQVITDNVRDALEKALNAMQFMGDTLNNLDAVCAEDVEHVTPAFEAIRKLLAAAPKPESE